MRASITAVLFLSTASFAAAQTPIPAQRVGRIKPKPYTMVQAVSFTHLFSNGMMQTHDSQVVTAMDSERRYRRETDEPAILGYTEIRDGVSRHVPGREKWESISVSDPVEKITLNWQTDPILRREVRLNRSGTLAQGYAFSPQSDKSNSGLTVDAHMEKLGQRAFAGGVIAEGTRTTTRYPAGFQGFSQEFTTVNENWFARDYGIIVESTSDDPRFGKTVTTLVSFSDQEPDPALFKPPAGYKLIETKTEIANPQEKN